MQRWAGPAVAAAVIYGVLLWLVISTEQWFWADDITYLAFRPVPRGFTAQVRDLLQPHNEHWTSTSLLVQRAIGGLVGWRAYWPYLSVTLAVHVLIVGLLWRRAREDDVRWWVAAPAALVLSFHGAGAENILWAFQFGFLLCTAAGWVLIELAASRTRVSLLWIWAAALVSLASAGLAPAFVVGGAFGALLRHGWRRAAAVAIPPAVVFLAWWRAYGTSGSIDGGDERLALRWGTFVPYAWDVIATSYDKTLGLRGVGPVIAVALLVGAASAWPRLRTHHLESLCLAAAAVVMFILIATGRAQLGAEDSSRYAYLSIALTLPLLLATVTVAAARVRPSRAVESAVLGVLLISLATSWTDLQRRAEVEGSNEELTTKQVAAAFVLARSSAARPDAGTVGFAPGLSIGTARRMIAAGEVPTGPVSSVRVREGNAVVMTDFSARPTYPLTTGVVRVADSGKARVAIRRPGCVTVSPTGPEAVQVVVAAALPASVRLALDGAGTVRVVIGIGAESVVALRHDGPAPVFWNLRDPRQGYVLEVPSGRTLEACGLDRNLPAA